MSDLSHILSQQQKQLDQIEEKAVLLGELKGIKFCLNILTNQVETNPDMRNNPLLQVMVTTLFGRLKEMNDIFPVVDKSEFDKPLFARQSVVESSVADEDGPISDGSLIAS